MIILYISWRRFQNIWIKKTEPFLKIYCHGLKTFRRGLENNSSQEPPITAVLNFSMYPLLSVYLYAKVNAIIIPSFYSILQLITLYIGFANTNLFVYKNLMVPDTFHAIQYDVFLINSFFSRSISFLSIINYMVVFKKDRVNFWSLVCPHGQSYFSFQESHPHSCRLTTAFFQNSLYLIFFASSLSDQLSKCQCWR